MKWAGALVLLASAAIAAERFSAWTENDLKAFEGEYVLNQPTGADPDSYIVSRITLKRGSGGWSAQYRTDEMITGGSNGVKAQLSGVKVTASGFEAAPIVAKPESAGFLPARFSGQFVQRYPPANAKGPVTRGLKLVSGEFFEKQ